MIVTGKLILLSRSKLEIHDSKAILFKEFDMKKIELWRWEGWRLDQLRQATTMKCSQEWTHGRTDGPTDGQTDGQTLLWRCEDASKNGRGWWAGELR